MVNIRDGLMPIKTLGPSTLEGNYVRLEPLRPNHLEGLADVAAKIDWSLMLYPLPSRTDVEQRINSCEASEAKDEEYPFAVINKRDNGVIGSTSYLGVVSRHKRVEIGSTWYLPQMRGTYVNPECKYLLLKHAFEDWGAVRAQLGTDARNIVSQRAILKLGAKLEGRLRNYGIRTGNPPRDTLLYSIIDAEWPEVKTKLISRIKEFETKDQPSS